MERSRARLRTAHARRTALRTRTRMYTMSHCLYIHTLWETVYVYVTLSVCVCCVSIGLYGLSAIYIAVYPGYL